MVLRGARTKRPSCSGSRPVCSCSTNRIRSTPGRISPPRNSPSADSTSAVVAVPALTTRHAPDVQRARRDQRRPAVGPELLGPVVTARHAAALGLAFQPQRLGVEDARPVDQQLVRAFAGHVRDHDALGVLVRRGERIDVVVRRGELDQRDGGQARPAAAVVPAPLDARIARVDGEDHAADTTRPLRTVRSATARAQLQRAVRRQSIGAAGDHAPVGQPHAQALPGVGVQRGPVAAEGLEAAGLEGAQRLQQLAPERGDDRIARGQRVQQPVERGDAAPQARAQSRHRAVVHADADHRDAAGALRARLDQDAAELGAAHQQVVGPLERRLRGAERAQRAHHGQAGDDRQSAQFAHRAAQRQRQREQHPGAGRAVPAAPAPAAAGALLVRGEQHRMRLTSCARSSVLVDVQRPSTRTSAPGTRIAPASSWSMPLVYGLAGLTPRRRRNRGPAPPRTAPGCTRGAARRRPAPRARTRPRAPATSPPRGRRPAPRRAGRA